MTEPAPTPGPGPDPATPSDAPVNVSGEPNPAPEPSPSPTPEPVKDWREGLDGELKEFASRLASPHEAVKSAYELRREISSRIKLPGKDARPEELAAFRKAVGAPEDVAAYFPAKEGEEPSESDKAIQGKVAAVLHKHYAPAAMAAELQAVVEEAAAAAEAEQDRVAKEFRETSLANLRKERGAEFDADVELAKRARDKLGTPALRDFLNSQVNGHLLGDHPELIRFFATVGRKMGESDFIGAVGKDQTNTIKDRLKDVDDRYYAALDANDRPKMQALDAERLALREQLHGVEPAVGSMGRTA